jgi:hypothetical protein
MTEIRPRQPLSRIWIANSPAACPAPTMMAVPESTSLISTPLIDDLIHVRGFVTYSKLAIASLESRQSMPLEQRGIIQFH